MGGNWPTKGLKDTLFVMQVLVCGRSCATYVVALVVPKRSQLAAIARSLGLDTQLPGEDENAAAERLCCEPKLVAAFLRQLAELGTKRGLDKFEVQYIILLVVQAYSYILIHRT